MFKPIWEKLLHNEITDGHRYSTYIGIVIVSNVSQSISIKHCNSLKSICLKEFPCVYKEKPSGVLLDSDNQNIHQLLHRLTLKQTDTNLRSCFSYSKSRSCCNRNWSKFQNVRVYYTYRFVVLKEP
jgi:hypothetical protein